MQNAAAVQEQSAFGEVALARAKEAKTRLGVGLGLALIGAYMTTPVIGLTWYLAVLAGQFLDWAVFAPVRRNPNARIPTDRRWLCAASLVINSLIYSSMAYACWFLGNAAGQVFAMMLLCGSLLHTTLHAAREKMLLAASVGLRTAGHVVDRGQDHGGRCGRDPVRGRALLRASGDHRAPERAGA
jgi:uncharacterized oligopeptide transporter (OPT) family protein